MLLINLISYFRSGGTFESFCEAQRLNANSEVIEIYAQIPVSAESCLGFFPIEESRGKTNLTVKGLLYQNLFDFFYFLEVIEDVKGNTLMGDAELAQILLVYALTDA